MKRYIYGCAKLSYLSVTQAMGSDRKSEEKRNRKRSPSSSSSEDEGKGKRRRTRDDAERKSRRSDKKEKSKEKKRSHKHSKHHSDKEKKTKDKHGSKHRHLKIDIQELSSDDYFSKNNEFSTWLKEEKDMYFSDLTSQSARELFSDFVKVWNKKKLDIKYYEGIASGPRCATSWIVKS